ncbi:hypothetical protein ISF_05070 [Cordyceps fumosorosea ARSEF 2679]|uniref:Uncharacterized protein n=1 Tax=Cordyceps fumosorosea (strain ARSEF 2679) TaxID=1081104 RepID=A0A167W0U4_CORFA|nr:hypothetical protein ISF_05070 [Cordyceps fumosorosea ARSEF 2679]OAA63194.1 hypothetical protein ISF_05070 [Cordyceps fumosorosea ARSEF 2679]
MFRLREQNYTLVIHLPRPARKVLLQDGQKRSPHLVGPVMVRVPDIRQQRGRSLTANRQIFLPKAEVSIYTANLNFSKSAPGEDAGHRGEQQALVDESRVAGGHALLRDGSADPVDEVDDIVVRGALDYNDARVWRARVDNPGHLCEGRLEVVYVGQNPEGDGGVELAVLERELFGCALADVDVGTATVLDEQVVAFVVRLDGVCLAALSGNGHGQIRPQEVLPPYIRLS